MSKLYDVAVVGATGAVGETMLSILAERNFPVGNVYPLASSRSAGSRVQFKGKHLIVKDLAEFDFSQTQIALYCFIFRRRVNIRRVCTQSCGSRFYCD